jgi:phospholipid-translocating ATPase
MHFHKRHPPADEVDPDDEANVNIDPNLRLRTLRTAHSAINESVHVEERAARRRTRRFFRRKSAKKREEAASAAPTASAAAAVSTHVPGRRRNIYVNIPLSAGEVDQDGEPTMRYVRNKVRTSSE